jgi:hypothetical protein
MGSQATPEPAHHFATVVGMLPLHIYEESPGEMNHRPTSWLIGAICAAGLLGACAHNNDVKDSSSAGVTTTSASATSSNGGSAAVNNQNDPGLKPYVDIAIADLALRLQINANTIVVTSAVLASFPDSSLGCPQPGQQYAQVANDGSVIMLSVGGKSYEYHSGGSRAPFLCEPVAKSSSSTLPVITPPSSTG